MNGFVVRDGDFGCGEEICDLGGIVSCVVVRRTRSEKLSRIGMGCNEDAVGIPWYSFTVVSGSCHTVY